MKINTEELKSALKLLYPLTGGRTTIPALQCFRLEAKHNELTIAASDIEQYFEIDVPCVGDLKACLVSGNLFNGFVMACTGDIELTPGKERITIIGNGEAVLSTLDAEQFPEKVEQKERRIAVNCEELADSIQGVAWVTDKTDVGRFNYEHIHVWLEAKRMLVQASNGKVMSSREKALICGEQKFTVNRNYTNNIVTMLKKDGADFSISERRLIVKTEKARWFGGLTDANWMCDSFQKSVESINKGIGSVKRSELVEALEIASMFARRTVVNPISPVRTAFGPKGIDLKCGDYHKEILGKFDKFNFSSDIAYLMPVIKHLKDADIKLMCANDGLHFMCFTDGDTYTYLAGLTQESMKTGGG